MSYLSVTLDKFLIIYIFIFEVLSSNKRTIQAGMDLSKNELIDQSDSYPDIYAKFNDFSKKETVSSTIGIPASSSSNLIPESDLISESFVDAVIPDDLPEVKNQTSTLEATSSRTESLQYVSDQLSQADEFLKKMISMQDNTQSTISSLQKRIEQLEKEKGDLQEQNQFLKGLASSEIDQKAKKKQAQDLLVTAQKVEDISLQKQAIDQANSIISQLQLQTSLGEEPSESLNEVQKTSDRAHQVASSAFEEIKEVSTSSSKKKDVDEVLKLISTPDERVRELREKFINLRKAEVQQFQLKLLKEAEAASDIAQKKRILEEVKRIEEDPDLLKEETRQKLLEAELIERVPENCREDLRVGLRLSDFDRSVQLSRSKAAMSSSLIPKGHIDEFMAATFVRWLHEQISTKNTGNSPMKKEVLQIKKKGSRSGSLQPIPKVEVIDTPTSLERAKLNNLLKLFDKLKQE